MTEPEQLNIICEALQGFPAHVRDELTGVAYLRLREIEDWPRDQQVEAVRRTCEYQFRREGRASGAELYDVGAEDSGLAAVELRDELSRLSREDRSIVALLLANHTQSEVANKLKLSPATITRRLQRLRGAIAL